MSLNPQSPTYEKQLKELLEDAKTRGDPKAQAAFAKEIKRVEAMKNPIHETMRIFTQTKGTFHEKATKAMDELTEKPTHEEEELEDWRQYDFEMTQRYGKIWENEKSRLRKKGWKIP